MSLRITTADKMIDELEETLADLRSGAQDQSTDIKISKVLCRLAYAIYRSDPVRAETYASEAIVCAERAEYSKGIAECNSLYGTLAWAKGNYIRAAGYYTISLNVCEKTDNRKGKASCYSNLANICRNQGDYEGALELHFKSLRIKEELDDRAGMAKSYNNIGIIYDEWKEYENALEFYNRALLIFDELEDLQGIAISYNNIGVIYETREDYSRASIEYRKSLEIKEEIGDRKGIGNSYLNMGILHRKQGDQDSALLYCVMALDIFEEIGDKRGAVDTKNNIGHIYFIMKRFDTALIFLHEGLELSRQMGSKDLESDSNRFLTELYKARGEYEMALQHLGNYVALREELFKKSTAVKLAQMQVRYETESIEKEAEIYRSIFEHTQVGFYRISPEGRILMANNALADMLGYSSSEELLHCNFFDWRSNTADRIPDFLKELSEEGRISGLESVWHRKSGANIHVMENCRAIKDESDKILLYEGTVEDITDLKNAEEAIAESEEILRSMAENAPAFITIVDRDLTITYINHPVPGLSKEDVIGTKVFDFVEPEFHEIIRRKTDKVFLNGEPEFFLSRAAGPDGTTSYYENYLGAIRRGNEVVSVILIGVDITERMKADGERDKLILEIKERVKELDCLYGLSRLAENQDTPLEIIFRGLVQLILPAWQYPQYTCARIIFEGTDYESACFEETRWKQEAPILINGDERGSIQVFYMKEFPDSFEGPFHREERHLLNELADRIEKIIQAKQAIESLAAERKRLSYILEGTNVGTWEWNVQTGETSFNERWAEIIGYTLDELSPVSIETWKKYCHPDDLKTSTGLLSRHFTGEVDYYECEVRMSHKIGAWVWVLDRGKVISWTDEGAPLLMAGTHEDITTRKLSESRVRHLATHDALTELPTMRFAMERMSMTLDLASRNGTMVAVMFIDLDDFKLINDRYGHEAGDNLLRVISGRFLNSVRKVDTVARIGGDEFLLIISELTSQSDAVTIAKNLVEAAAQPVPFNGEQMTTGASIGISIYPDSSEDADTLIKLADTAMYMVKDSGKNGFTFS